MRTNFCLTPERILSMAVQVESKSQITAQPRKNRAGRLPCSFPASVYAGYRAPIASWRWNFFGTIFVFIRYSTNKRMGANQANGSPLSSGLPPTLIQFGVFELKPGTGELWKHGVRVKLQGKPFQILLALIDRPGEVVTREELRARLWPADTFVDFESGLNTAANRLRLTLGDSAEKPHYVETLPRVGYRFIAPVKNIPSQHITLPRPIATTPLSALPEIPPRGTRIRWIWLTPVAAALIAGLALIWPGIRSTSVPSFHQITFRRGVVAAARFAPDGESVLYSATWGKETKKAYRANLVSPESREIGFSGQEITSVSRKGELALLANDYSVGYLGSRLLRVRENGGAPLAVSQDVGAADWAPDGENMAVIRPKASEWSIEFPLGKPVYRAGGWLSCLRISPDGKRIAFIEHPVRGDDAGFVRIMEPGSAPQTLSDGWASAWGLAWAPAGNEVWFTASRSGQNRSLYAVTAAGKLRQIAAMPGNMTLHDISPSHRVLISRDDRRMLMVRSAPDGTERDISWFDLSNATAISADGNLVLFDETGEGGGPGYSVYMYRADSGTFVRLCGGRAIALSPDGKWTITAAANDDRNLRLIPLDPGQSRAISANGFTYLSVKFFPDGQHLLIGGYYRGKEPKLYVQDLTGGSPRPLEPDIWLGSAVISDDGADIAGVHPVKKLVVMKAAGGELTPVPLPFPAAPARWSSDGRSLFVVTYSGNTRILRVDLKTGQHTLWKTIAPADAAGVTRISAVLLSRDAKSYVYSYNRTLSELYTVTGWR